MRKYELVINEFCERVGLQDSEYARNGGAIEIDGAVFSFIYDDKTNADVMFLYVDFGLPPAENEATVYYDLLKRNFLMFAGKGPAFTISPITGHVVYVEHFRLEEVTPDLLAQAAIGKAKEAMDWRTTHFLSGAYALRKADASSTALPFSSQQP